MSDPLGMALAGLIMFVGVSSAYAASGRVVFSGGVVEPTCSTAGPDLAVMHSRAGATPQRMSCGNASADASRTYTREVIDLATASRHHDRLLDYFASYAPRRADGDPAAGVVVQTWD